jgi:HAD superfamily hydrolase (TIGR01509 family)
MYRAVLFDFDGTLTKPGAIDFAALRQLLGCPPKVPILEFIDSLGSAEARREAHLALDEFELAAARASAPNDGAEELVRRLARAGIACGILSRNSLGSIREALKRFRQIGVEDFPVIVTREDEGRPKPHPDGVHRAAELFGVAPGEMLVVGDYVFDIEAGKAAGVATAFLSNGAAVPAMGVTPDFTIAALGDLNGILGLCRTVGPQDRL